MTPVCIAYYCSGHGYGHATRVSAFACQLLSLSDTERPVVLHIISSAPQHVFSESITCGARYRHAEVDPVVVQPLAYRVDRGKSVQALQAFLKKKDALLEVERQWLLDMHANVVLSDAAFLGCQAAKLAGIPSVLITNFTFDSVYSYLSTPLREVQSPNENGLASLDGSMDDSLDIPVPPSTLKSLVDQIHFGYRCADLLLRLPGHIPIPSFTVFPSLPSSEWVDATFNQFTPEILDHLYQPVETYSLHPAIPYSRGTNNQHERVTRSIISAPLFVRPPSSFNVYLPSGRAQLLSSIGVPEHLRDPLRTKILIVSFGGQFIRAPSRPGSRNHSRPVTPRTPSPIADNEKSESLPPNENRIPSAPDRPNQMVSSGLGEVNSRLASSHSRPSPPHIWVSTALPALKVIPATPVPQTCSRFPSIGTTTDEGEPRLLPDSSWIAIICGVSKEQWISQLDTDVLPLPNEFFIAPRDIYMPDLTAVGDVLLGKLGYGTVSECVDACTPFVYVSRPLFIEEHGLRLLLKKEGVGVELARTSYECGNWAEAIDMAWRLGRDMKVKRREEALLGTSKTRQQEMRELAETVLRWAQEGGYQ